MVFLFGLVLLSLFGPCDFNLKAAVRLQTRNQLGSGFVTDALAGLGHWICRANALGRNFV